MRFRLTRRGDDPHRRFDAARPIGAEWSRSLGSFANCFSRNLGGTPGPRGVTEQERADADGGGGLAWPGWSPVVAHLTKASGDKTLRHDLPSARLPS
jgi:hypothetical protein